MPFHFRRPARLALFASGTIALATLAFAQEVRWAPQQDPPATMVPPSPEDPTQAKAYAVLDRLCASCHQVGKLQVPKPAYGIGNVLDLGRVALNPSLVRPGLPDGSRLFTMMQIRSAPHDFEDVAASDLDAIRDWIGGLKPAVACADRTPLSETDDERAIQAAPSDAALTTRYLSLRGPYNRCATPVELKAYRDAVTITLNSLSWAQKPVVLSTIDPQETLIRVDLAALGWDVARWQRLLEAYPFASSRTSAASAPTTLRADWFVAQALKPPLYYDLLGLPDRLLTLQMSLRIDATNDILQNKARRIGIKSSTVARGNRLIQRHAFANGGFWTTFEYAPTQGRPDLFEAPGGPGTRGASKPDASLAIFNLPSGYKAFYMANGDGLRLNDLPQSVVRNDSYPSQRVSIGADCVACHSRGVLPAQDELRARVQGDTSIPRDIRDKALALLAPQEEMRRLMDEDNTRLGGALAQSGLVPGATLAGDDPVTALIAFYDRDVSIETLASELAVPVATLKELAGRTTGLAGDLMERLVHGPVSRRSVERAYSELMLALEGKPLTSGNAMLSLETDRPEGLQLVLKTGAQSFKAGETLTIKARASDSCYLTLINVDRTGRGTVVFPNDFEQNNFVEAGKEVRVPADGAPYVFRLRDPGRETIIGHCMAATKVPAGIRHDFERQRFTELGEYRAFLTRTAANDAEAKVAAPKVAVDPKNRRRGAVAPAKTGPQKGEGQARAAIFVDVVP